MAWCRSSSSSSGGVGSSRLKRQQLGSLLFLQQHQHQLHFGCWSSLLPCFGRTRRKLSLAIVATLLSIAIISHPFILFHWYHNNHKNHHHHNVLLQQHPLSSSSSSILFSTDAVRKQRRRNNVEGMNNNHDIDENNDNLLLLLKPGCLTEACIHATAAAFLTRTYPNRTDQRWCLKSGETNNSSLSSSSLTDATMRNALVSHNNEGILLIKVPKGASSTAAGVAIRIARRRNCNIKTGLQWRHQPAFNSTFAHRSRQNNSFLFTTIRDPAHRAVSSIFFHVVSRLRIPPSSSSSISNNNDNNNNSSNNNNNNKSVVSDEFLLQYLQEHAHPHHGAVSQPGQGGFQLQYMSMEEEVVILPPSGDTNDPSSGKRNSASNLERSGVVVHPERMLQRVRATMNAYDFILVTERMVKDMCCCIRKKKRTNNVFIMAAYPRFSLVVGRCIYTCLTSSICAQDESLVAMSILMVRKRRRYLSKVSCLSRHARKSTS
jgi:Sulfotransferase family